MNFDKLYSKVEILEEARTSSVWLPGWQNMLVNTRKFQTKLQQEEGLKFPTPINALAKYALATIDGVISGKIDADSSGAEIETELEDQVKQEKDTGLPYTQLISKLKEITDPKVKEEINKVWTAAISADNPIEYWAMREINFSNRKLSDDQYKSQITDKRDHLKGLISRTFLGGNIEAVQKAKEEEKAAKKSAAQAVANDISPLTSFEAQDSFIEIVADPEITLDMNKVKKFFAAANKGGEFEIDPDTVTQNSADIMFGADTPVTKIITKIGADKVESSIKSSLTKALGLTPGDLSVVVHAPGKFEFSEPKEKKLTKAQQTGVDTSGYGLGTVAGDDSARRLANPFEDEEVPVKEVKKPVVKFIANKDIKAKTYWQKMAQQEMYYR